MPIKDFLEKEFEEFMQAGFGDRFKNIGDCQLTEMRRAFYAGLTIACVNMDKQKEILRRCNKFFDEEVEKHLKNQGE